MEHKVLLDYKNYKTKPTHEEIGSIQNRLHDYKKSMAVNELLKAATNGYSFKLSLLAGVSNKTFMSTSLLAIDVDNKNPFTKKQIQPSVSFKEAQAQLKKHHIYVAGAYTTFSHKEKWPRYRILIQLDRPITYLREAEQLYMIVKQAFSFQDAAIHPCSLLFGGKDILYSDDLAITKIDDIFKIYQQNHAQTLDSQGKEQSGEISTQSYLTYISNIDCAEKPKNSTTPSPSTLKETFLRNILKYNQTPITFDTFQAAISYVQKLPLDDLLGLDRSCFCVVHKDNHPSAGIFKYSDDTYHYHCFSCGVLMDITDFIADFFDFNKEKDFIDLCTQILRLFNIRIVDNKWKQGVERQIMLSKKNLKFIEKYIGTHKLAVNALIFSDSVYRLLLDECLISLEYVPAKDSFDLPLTRASLRYIAKRTSLSLSKVRVRLERLQQAGFIRQLSDEETKKASRYFGNNARLHKEEHTYTINTYAINYISDTTICQAQFNLMRFKESGATSRATSCRQSKYTGNNETCVKSKNTKSSFVQQEEALLIDWAIRTVKRKGCFMKEALIRYGLSKNIKKENIEKTITKITFELDLKRVIGSNMIIQKYNLPQSALRKVIFIKKD